MSAQVAYTLKLLSHYDDAAELSVACGAPGVSGTAPSRSWAAGQQMIEAISHVLLEEVAADLNELLVMAVSCDEATGNVLAKGMVVYVSDIDPAFEAVITASMVMTG